MSGVVEGAVAQLLLERLAVVDVARGEDDAADARVVEQVGGHRGDVAMRAVGVAHPPLGLLRLVRPACGRHGGEERLDERGVLRVHALEQRLALRGLPAWAEDRLDRAGERASLVASASRISDQVGGVLDDRLQPVAALLRQALQR